MRIPNCQPRTFLFWSIAMIMSKCHADFNRANHPHPLHCNPTFAGPWGKVNVTIKAEAAAINIDLLTRLLTLYQRCTVDNDLVLFLCLRGYQLTLAKSEKRPAQLI